MSLWVKKMKIGQYLPTLWAIKYRVVFLTKHGKKSERKDPAATEFTW